MENADYIVFRYFILKEFQQGGRIDFPISTSKEEMVREVFKEIELEKKVEFVYRATRYLIYHEFTDSDDLFVFSLSRESKENEYAEGDDKLIKRSSKKLHPT